MAGGTFDKMAGKVRPGTYINFESTGQSLGSAGERGVVILPLIGHPYGPDKRFLTLTSDAPDSAFSMLGYSVYDDIPTMVLVREAFRNAKSVIVYIPAQGAKAAGSEGNITAAARYGGSRGNNLRFSVTANPLAGFDVTIWLGTTVVSQYEGLTTVEELTAQNDAWIAFSGSGSLTATAGVTLTGGTDAPLTAADITEFLDKSEAIKWNTMAFPMEADETNPDDPTPGLLAAVKAKIKYLREDAGKYRQAVVANYTADYEGVINVTNSVVVGGKALTPAQATAWVAGATAGATNTTSNTYTVYEGATDIVGLKSHVEAVAAINNGEFFFSFSEEGSVVVEYDINSLISFAAPKNSAYRKNRVIRVFDSFAEALMLNFPPNKFSNSPTGWDVMEGIGRSILKQFFEAGAIKNVDYDMDFSVDRGLSNGDETYFTVGLEAVDSAEKLFFTIKTQ